MTPFRKNLQRLRDEYHETRYAGDLAAQLLGVEPEAGDAPTSYRIDGATARQVSGWRRVLPFIGTAAAAAAVAVGAMLVFTDRSVQSPVSPSNDVAIVTTNEQPIIDVPQNNDTTVGTNTTTTTETVAEDFTLVPSASLMGEGASFFPEAQPLSFGLDEWAAQEAEAQQQQQTGTSAATTGGAESNAFDDVRN